VVQGWLTTIEAAFAEDEDEDSRDKQKRAAEKRKSREHRVVPVLIPDYLNALEQAEARRAELDAQFKAATATSDDDDDVSAETLSPAELKTLKADLATARREVKHLENEFIERLRQAVVKLNAETEEALVIRIFKSDLQDRLDAEVSSGRRALISRYRTWADKYGITLRDLEAQRDKVATKLENYLKELGYG